MTTKRQWRRPTEEDKLRKCRARSSFEEKPFYVAWNSDWDCWGMYGKEHILVAVHEILEPKVEVK